MREKLLELDNITLRFGGISALKNISFDVLEGEVRAIVGPNGGGKSSMLNVINGIYRSQGGTVKLRGELIRRPTPSIMARKSIARTFQNIGLFKTMTVLENVIVGRMLHFRSNIFQHALFSPGARRDEISQREKAEEILEFLKLQHLRHRTVGTLPYGLQKRVELARALVSEPELLLLDEPMAGMNVEEKQEMCRFVLGTNQSLGTTIVLIEHDMGVVMDISDRIVVLDYGKKIADGVPSEVRNNEDVIRAYLGASA